MDDLLITLNQSAVLWTLLSGAILTVLIDYFFPVDWLAYVGYAMFALFVGLTIATTPIVSVLAAVGLLAAMLLLHFWVFSSFLTNAPKHERFD